MARTNLSELRKKMEAAAEAVTARIEQERQADAARLQHHLESSKAQVELLHSAEAEVINYIETFAANTIQGIQAVFTRMREDEHRRLAALETHVLDINTEEEPEQIEEPPKQKRLKAVN